MKALKFIIIGMVLLLSGAAKSQFSMSLNFGTPPLWGPAGYAEASYYYLPDVEAFYDVHSTMFIYYSGGVWIHRANLPARYKDYDLYGGYKVVMKDYHGKKPYSHFKEYKSKYGRGYNGHDQKNIGERPAKGNPGGKNPHGNGHGNGENQGQGHDNGQSHDNDKHKNGNK